ncbi:unnamed protein product [Echinostoma caproni]|uniref:Nuclear receptor domain-containing protein n=1 Tax=Echinostoma caproni TaxID=27848 RepID=A0A183A8Y5_9TREM|nr:unnamed protein product [Echinostoma caproni]
MTELGSIASSASQGVPVGFSETGPRKGAPKIFLIKKPPPQKPRVPVPIEGLIWSRKRPSILQKTPGSSTPKSASFSVSRTANVSAATATSTSISLPSRKSAEVVEMAGEVIELVIAPGKQARSSNGDPMVVSDEEPPSVVRILRLPTEALPVDSSNRRRKTKPEGRSPEPCFVCQVSTTGQRLGIPTCLECDRTFFRMFVDIFNLKRSCSCPVSGAETTPLCTQCRLRTCMEKALRQWGARLSHRALQSWLSVDQSMDILFKNAKSIDDIVPLLGKCGLSSSQIPTLDFPGDGTSVSSDDSTIPMEVTKRRLLDSNIGIPTAMHTPSSPGRRPLASSSVSKSIKAKIDWPNSSNISRPLLPKPSLNPNIRVIELPPMPSSSHTTVPGRPVKTIKLEPSDTSTDSCAQPTYIQVHKGSTTITRAILPKPSIDQPPSPVLSTEMDEVLDSAPLTEEEVLGRRLSRIIKPGFMQVFSKHFKSLPSEPQLLDTALDNRSTLFQLFEFFDWEWNLPIEVPSSVRQAVWTVFHEQFNESLTDMVRFIKRVPGFPILKPQDRILLVRNSGFELAFLVHYLNWNTEFVCWHGPENFVLTLEQLCAIFPAGMKFFHYAFTNTKRLTKLTQQLQHLGLFAALIILDDELPNLNDRDTVKALRERVMDAIRYNLKVRQQDVEKVVSRIQIGVQKLRKMGVEHRKVLESLRSDDAFEFPDDLYAELFELISD